MCAGIVVFAPPGVKVAVSWKRNAHVCLRALNLPCRASSCLVWPLPCAFKNVENARTVRPKSNRASGWHAKTANVQKSPRLSAKVGLRPQQPNDFEWFLEGSKRPPRGPQEAPKRPPRGPQEASLQPCPQEAPRRPPRSPQEAPKRPQCARICEWSLPSCTESGSVAGSGARPLLDKSTNNNNNNNHTNNTNNNDDNKNKK